MLRMALRANAVRGEHVETRAAFANPELALARRLAAFRAREAVMLRKFLHLRQRLCLFESDPALLKHEYRDNAQPDRLKMNCAAYYRDAADYSDAACGQ